MKISGINKNTPSFGLRIVNNNALRENIRFQVQRGYKKEDILDCYKKIQGLYSDDLSLEFVDLEEKNSPIIGTYTTAKYRFSGQITATASGKKYPVNFTTEDGDKFASHLTYTPENIEEELKALQKKIDNEDRETQIIGNLKTSDKDLKLSKEALKYFARSKFLLDTATIQFQKDGKAYMTGRLCMNPNSVYYKRGSQTEDTSLYTNDGKGKQMVLRNISLHGSTPLEMALEFAKKYNKRNLYNIHGEYITTTPNFYHDDILI